MGETLKHYQVKITALSPIFIGDGRSIGKKEYIYLPLEKKIIVPDMEKMYSVFRKKRQDQAYMDYMVKNYKDSFGVWLKQQGYSKSDYFKWKKYELDTGDAFLQAKTGKTTPVKEIACFVKDPYGLPYVPGSSIKGMIRTALLAYEIHQNPERFRHLKEKVEESVKQRTSRKQCLSSETKSLEVKAFHTLKKKEEKISDALNCNLSGLIVSDSQPIPLERLTLSQKVDYTLKGEEKPLPILRESLKPGTEIFFHITIHEECPYTMADILAALDYVQQVSYHHFYEKFHRGTREKGTVWLGGGVGFLSKTVLYAMFEKKTVPIVDAVFKNTLGPKVYKMHKHDRDMRLGISPHVCKCTRYHNKLYDVGMGKIEVLK